MNNTVLRTFAVNDNGDIARALRKYYYNDPYLLRDLRKIAKKLIDWPTLDPISAVHMLEKLDEKLEELACTICSDEIRPLSYALIVDFRIYINKVLNMLESNI